MPTDGMSRYSIRADIVAALKEIEEIKAVAATYPENWKVLPCAVYSCESRPAGKNKSTVEFLTQWTITIELFTNKSGIGRIAESVQQAINQMGFSDVRVKDANIKNLNRKIITVSGVVNNRTLQITRN
ncbi:hypothetical protein IW492_02660 [Enterococcus sp. BWB1-3]|uniref:hypothetical protein n=1 Tax=Enterococcus sp. BWB1-3 TaxID=2787713 RepID=UPI001923B1E5|nr:hypothetical protein [Enterococcus sp. BWB1-3]MBL1228133.1 hypothetical protein [Enterococcus sp. BWB1-3]